MTSIYDGIKREIEDLKAEIARRDTEITKLNDLIDRLVADRIETQKVTEALARRGRRVAELLADIADLNAEIARLQARNS